MSCFVPILVFFFYIFRLYQLTWESHDLTNQKIRSFIFLSLPLNSTGIFRINGGPVTYEDSWIRYNHRQQNLLFCISYRVHLEKKTFLGDQAIFITAAKLAAFNLNIFNALEYSGFFKTLGLIARIVNFKIYLGALKSIWSFGKNTRTKLRSTVSHMGFS